MLLTDKNNFGFSFDTIQEKTCGELVPPPYHFFPCNFYKRRT